jgi:hypothetical protein
MQRRDFLKATAVAALPVAADAILESLQAVVSAAEPGAVGRPQEEGTGSMLYRTLGRTGEKVSAIGLGGSHIGKQKDPEESIRIIRAAIDAGITFMDNCWDYNQGQTGMALP